MNFQVTLWLLENFLKPIQNSTDIYKQLTEPLYTTSTLISWQITLNTNKNGFWNPTRRCSGLILQLIEPAQRQISPDAELPDKHADTHRVTERQHTDKHTNTELTWQKITNANSYNVYQHKMFCNSTANQLQFLISTSSAYCPTRHITRHFWNNQLTFYFPGTTNNTASYKNIFNYFN